MKVEQIYEIMNDVTGEILGESAVLEEDLSNIVDIGTQILNQSDVDNYVKTLIDRVGKVVFVNRPYSGSTPSVLMDGWEFGSILQKITARLPEATENESWELEDGTSYDPNVFYKPEVYAKFWNKRVTFEVPISITEMQVKESFASREELNGFLSMIYTAVDKSMTVKLDALVMRTINNMVAETVYDDFGSASLSSKSGVKAINLLYLYNDKFDKELTADEAITDPDFIRFSAYEMGVTSSRLSKLSTLFNVGGTDKFTPPEMLHVVMLSDFRKSANVYLQSDVFHDEFTRLPNAEEVPYWQGSGTSYAFEDISKVDVVTSGGHDVTVTGLLGIMFDRDALGVANLNRRTTTNYNPKAEFWNNWYKMEAGYFNDLNENMVVFFVA